MLAGPGQLGAPFRRLSDAREATGHTDERTSWSAHGALPWPADDVISDCGATAPHSAAHLNEVHVAE
jgi:hypothetical protein